MLVFYIAWTGSVSYWMKVNLASPNYGQCPCLDEGVTDLCLAHWIRNQETGQFRSVNTLQAGRRWCLTGTPIQNRLEDLGALVRFLKVPPFEGKSSKAEFKRCIIDPIFSDADDPCQTLRRLLQTTLLRRTSQSQSNLKVNHQSITLALSGMEQLQYDSILEKVRMDMDAMVSTESNGQKYTKLFSMILRLRIFCDLGQSTKKVGSSPSQLNLLQVGSPAESDLGSELGCDVCQKDESLDLLKDRVFCPSCSRLLGPATSLTSGSRPDSPWETSSSLPETSPDTDAPRISIQPPDTLQKYLLQLPRSNQLGRSGTDAYPTKLLAVANNLRHNIDHSKRYGLKRSAGIGRLIDLTGVIVSSSLAGQRLWTYYLEYCVISHSTLSVSMVMSAMLSARSASRHSKSPRKSQSS